MTMKYDFVDAIMIQELKQVYRDHAVPDKIDNSNDIIEPDQDFLDAINKLLAYYMAPADIMAWAKELENESKDRSL